MSEVNSNGARAMKLWEQWQNWAMATLFAGLVWFLLNDRANIIQGMQVTNDRQLLNSERLMHLEDNYIHMLEGQSEMKAQQREMNLKLDAILAKVKK